jgi:uncharacterized membrane protein YdjX (TVP38/TMEM64 family)
LKPDQTPRQLLRNIGPYLATWTLGITALTLGLYLFRDELVTYLQGRRAVPESVDIIQLYFERYGALAPTLYALFFGFSLSLFFPFFLLCAAAGIIFNPYLGFPIVVCGLALAAQTFYWIGRFGGNAVLNLFGQRTLSLVHHYLPKRTGKVVFLCRLVYFMPFNPFNAVCGAFRVPWQSYSLATVLGLLPKLLVYYYVGVSLRPEHGSLWGSALGLVSLVVLESLFGAYLLQVYLQEHWND